MHTEANPKLQEIDKLLQGIDKLRKKLKRFTHMRNIPRQDKVIKKFILYEEKVQSVLSEVSEQKLLFKELEELRQKSDEYDKKVEEFEGNLDEEQYERYKDLRKSKFYQEQGHDMTSTVSSSSFSNHNSADARSSMRSLSISQSIKIDQINRVCCKCSVI